jgi:hypothetical protein
MVPVEEADDAEEAEEESSSCCCSSVSRRSACSSSSASSNMTGGMAGSPVSLDLAKALWRSLMVGDFAAGCRRLQTLSRESEGLAMSHTLPKHILKLLVSGKVQKAYSLETDDFVVVGDYRGGVVSNLARISDNIKRGRADPCRELGLGLRQTVTRRGVGSSNDSLHLFSYLSSIIMLRQTTDIRSNACLMLRPILQDSHGLCTRLCIQHPASAS